MNLRLTVVAIAAGILYSSGASAQIELARARNCLACHSVETKILGPAYKDVAARYAKDPDAAARLSKKVREGGVGAWGKVPMPANPRVTEAEADSLVHWILSLKK